MTKDQIEKLKLAVKEAMSGMTMQQFREAFGGKGK